MTPITLSVLDQVPVKSGSTAAAALRETLELAEHVDRLGYRRYWLAEHHNSSALSCASPEILIPLVAERTSRIRVGSGGVMLPHYSPLKVAEEFRLLETLYPGRIDLGIGRAPGSDQLTAAVLAYGRELGIDRYPDQVVQLIDFLAGHELEHPLYGRVRATPDVATTPELWLLGSGIDSAVLAGQLGCAYSHAHFINPSSTAEALERYRAEFRPGVLDAPLANVGVSALCADTDDEADRLSLSRYLWWVKITRGEYGPFPSVAEAQDYPYTDSDRVTLEKLRRRSLVGSPERVRERLTALADELAVDELVILTITHDPAARRRSYELLASAFGLEANDGRPQRVLGSAKGLVEISEDFDAPLPDFEEYR